MEPCHVKGCSAVAVAFLQVELKAGDERIIKQRLGYCQPHAIEKHNSKR